MPTTPDFARGFPWSELTIEAFAENLRRERESRGLSQAALAEMLRQLGLSNFHPTTISRIESGERPVALHEAAVIARQFESSLDVMAAKRVDALAAVAESSRTVAQCINTVAGLEDSLKEARAKLLGAVEAYHARFADARRYLSRNGDGDSPRSRDRVAIEQQHRALMNALRELLPDAALQDEEPFAGGGARSDGSTGGDGDL